MLDVLLYRYSLLPQPALIGISLLFLALGGLLGTLILPRRTFTLNRSLYFVQTAVAGLALKAMQLFWLAYLPALKAGVSGLLLVVDLGSSMLCGLYILHIARARSRDGWGDDRRAWMAFVPVLNLGLLFRPSLTAQGRGGSALVGVGFLILFLTRAMGDAIVEEVTRRSLQPDPDALQAMQVIALRADGIEQGLDKLIEAEGAPQSLGPTLTLTSVSRTGLRLVYEFKMDEPDATALDADYRKQVTNSFCDGLMIYLTEGASARLHYVRVDGAEVETLDLSVTACTT